jgi:hypothetical protein
MTVPLPYHTVSATGNIWENAWSNMCPQSNHPTSPPTHTPTPTPNPHLPPYTPHLHTCLSPTPAHCHRPPQVSLVRSSHWASAWLVQCLVQ